MLSQQELQALLTQFAPEVRFHTEEKYFPCSVDWFLQRTKLCNQYGMDVRGMNPAQDSIHWGDSASLADRYFGERIDFTLNVLNPENDGNPNDYAGDLGSAPCYSWARPVKDSTSAITAYDLNYAFFHAWNGNIFSILALTAYLTTAAIVLILGAWFITPWLALVPALGMSVLAIVSILDTYQGVNMHEGDWEGVVVRVDPMGNFQKMYFFQHNVGEWVTSPSKNPAGQFVVYSALNSHASYPTADYWIRIAGLANDYTEDGGQTWNTRRDLIFVGHDDSASASAVFGSLSENITLGDSFPAMAANDNGVMVIVSNSGEVIQSKIGSYNKVTRAVSWPPTQDDQQVDAGCVGNPVIAMNNAGVIVSMHQGTYGGIWYNLGMLTTSPGLAINWGTTHMQGKQLPGTFPAQPILAMNNLGVVLYGYGYGDEMYWKLGTLNGPEQSIDWNGSATTNRSAYLVDGCVAINDVAGLVNETTDTLTIPDCDVIYVFNEAGSIYYMLGVISGQGTILTWNDYIEGGWDVQGTNPRVAINDQGLIVEVHLVGDGVLMGNIGQITLADDGMGGQTKVVRWTPFNPQAQHDFLGAAVALTQDQTVVLVKQNKQKLYSAGVATVETLDSVGWQPLNGQDWMKYSGHWGQKGTEPFLESPVRLSTISPGPTGPAFKSNWILGPDKL